jgi:hypothetical protein
LIGNDANLRKKYPGSVIQAINAFVPSETVLGRVNRIKLGTSSWNRFPSQAPL